MTPPAAGPGATVVLIAEDERAIADVVAAVVTEAGFAPVVAAHGRRALELAREHWPALLITDLVMPHLNGVDLTRRIREELPETQVILVSSYTEDAYMLMASDSGADVFVNKRVITSSLVPAVRDLIRRRLSGGSDQPPLGGGASSSYVPPK